MDNQNPNNNPKMPKFNMNWYFMNGTCFYCAILFVKKLDSYILYK